MDRIGYGDQSVLLSYLLISFVTMLTFFSLEGSETFHLSKNNCLDFYGIEKAESVRGMPIYTCKERYVSLC